jgi:GNAT superfamily N-acetyltransferase
VEEAALDETAGADIEAVIDGIAHKMAVEMGAELVRVQGAVAIRYRSPLHHPWPRAVDLTLDILAADLPSTVAAAQATVAAGEPHRAHVFGCDVGGHAAAIEAAGYDGCWNTQLLALDLAAAQVATAADLAIETVEREAQIDELNALQPEFPSYRESRGRPEFFDLLGRRAGAAVAKGQIVCASRRAAYVADMFTAARERNTGCAGAMLSALHEEARRRGLRRAVLIPSLMAAETSFYDKRGYRRVSTDAVLLSKS